jgi:hypothetical protein
VGRDGARDGVFEPARLCFCLIDLIGGQDGLETLEVVASGIACVEGDQKPNVGLEAILDRATTVRESFREQVWSYRGAEAPDDRATEVALNRFHVRSWLYELHAERRKTRTRTVASRREHPSEAAFDKDWRIDLPSREASGTEYSTVRRPFPAGSLPGR